MKKFNEKRLPFVGSWFRPLIVTNLCIMFLICSVTAFSSDPTKSAVADEFQQTITGKVTDASTGEPLIGVTILVKGTTTGALTDVNGNFSIPASSRQPVTLTISFIGYTAQEVSATPGTNVAVALALAVTEMQEVVVVGYGTQKKESVVGAITQVSTQALVQSGTQNVTNAIAGKLSGVLTIQQTGEPGNSSAEIIVRGLSSWNGSAPLVLVDGVERDFSFLDPNEINTISVLKDASATAVFGAKGANGVIVVTSKRGALGKPKLDFSASYGIQKATRIPDHIDSYTTMSDLNVARMNGSQFSSLMTDWQLEQYRNPSDKLYALQFPNVNWFDELSRPFAPNSNANLNITGGTEFVKYFLSLGYKHEGDFFKGNKEGYVDSRYWSNQFNYRINVDFALSKTSTLSLNVGGEVDIKNQPQDASWRDLYSTGPARYPAYFPAWLLEELPDPLYPNIRGDRFTANFGEYTSNPYTRFNNNGFRRYLGSRLFTDLIFKQELNNITKGLFFNGKVSLSTYYRNRTLTIDNLLPDYKFNYNNVVHNPDGTFSYGTNKTPGPLYGTLLNPWERNGQSLDNYTIPPYDVNVGGLEGGYYSDLYYEMSLNYGRTFGKHTVSGLALFNRQQRNRETQFPYYNEGLVGRATYDFNHKYLIEVNVGYTGSERFAPANRFGFFPSAAVGWVISEENFFKQAVPWMNKLKVRYSDGLVGSDYAKSRWLYSASYFKDDRSYIREDLGANMSAQWEMAHKRDLGFEFGFLQNMFTLNVDLFDEYRNKMLLTPRSVTMLVGNSFKELNLGELKKHGIELEAEFRKSPSPNFEYNIRALFGFNENRVIFKDDPPYAPEYMKLANKPLSDLLSVEFNIEGLEFNQVQLTGTGYYTSVDDIHNNPAAIDLTKLVLGDYKYLDFNSDGIVSSLDKYPGKGLTYPPITYSFSGGFRFKNFDFNMMWQGNVGKYVHFNQGYEVEFIKGDWRLHQSQLDFWSPDNQDASHATLHYFSGTSQDNLFWGGGEEDRGYQAIIMDRFFRNADYLRLKDVYLGYTFTPAYLNKIMGVSGMLVYATANNLITFTKLIEGDPERKDFQQGFYPQMTSVKVGVKLNF